MAVRRVRLLSYRMETRTASETVKEAVVEVEIVIANKMEVVAIAKDVGAAVVVDITMRVVDTAITTATMEKSHSSSHNRPRNVMVTITAPLLRTHRLM
jgi:hypothetical protein